MTGLRRTVGAATLLGMVGLEVCLAFGYYALATVLPQVCRGFDADRAYSVAAAAPFITSVVGLVVASPWVDRVGPRWPLTWGFAGLVTGEVGCAAAPGIAVFVAGRLVLGLGTGIVGVALYGLISHAVPPEHRSAVFGWLNGSWLIPSLTGPLLAALMAQRWGWRSVFWAVAVLMAVSYTILAVGIRRRRMVPEHGARRAVPWLWAALAAVALIALHLGGEDPSAAGTTASAVGLVLTVLAMRRVLPAGTLAARAGAPRLIALRGVLAAGAGAAEVYVPYYLQHQRGVTLAGSGFVLAATAVGWTVGASVQAGWARRCGPERLLRWCAVLGPMGPVAVLVVIVTTGPVWLIPAGLAVMGLGLGAAMPQISAASMDLTPTAEHASLGGALQLCEAAAGGALLAVTGIVLAHGGSHSLAAAYAVLVAVGALGLVVAGHGVGETAQPS